MPSTAVRVAAAGWARRIPILAARPTMPTAERYGAVGVVYRRLRDAAPGLAIDVADPRNSVGCTRPSGAPRPGRAQHWRLVEKPVACGGGGGRGTRRRGAVFGRAAGPGNSCRSGVDTVARSGCRLPRTARFPLSSSVERSLHGMTKGCGVASTTITTNCLLPLGVRASPVRHARKRMCWWPCFFSKRSASRGRPITSR